MFNKWSEYSTIDDTPFRNSMFDGMDHNHSVWCPNFGRKDDAIIYHNDGEHEGSEYYYAASFWNGNGYDGACSGDLEDLQRKVEKYLKVQIPFAEGNYKR